MQKVDRSSCHHWAYLFPTWYGRWFNMHKVHWNLNMRYTSTIAFITLCIATPLYKYWLSRGRVAKHWFLKRDHWWVITLCIPYTYILLNQPTIWKFSCIKHTFSLFSVHWKSWNTEATTSFEFKLQHYREDWKTWQTHQTEGIKLKFQLHHQDRRVRKSRTFASIEFNW